jgi:hypothetical protein
MLPDMTGPVLYTAEVDYPAEHHPLFSDWYASRHAPDLIRAGFRTATSYRAVVGGLAVLNVYEVPDTAVFKSEAYKGVLTRDPYGADVRGTSAGKMRAQTVYLERATTAADAGPMDADWISLLRFAAAETEDAALIDWLRGDAQKQLAPLGVKRVRLGTRSPDKIGAGTHRPRCMVLAEWASQPPREADLLPALTRRFGAAVTDAEPYVGWRAYPWPDVKRK